MSLNIFQSEADLQEEIAATEKHAKRDAVKSKILYSFAAILLALVPLGLLWLIGTTFYEVYEESQKHRALEKNGVETDAFLQNAYIEVTRKGQKAYRLKYTFRVNEQSFSGESEVKQRPVSFGISQRTIYDPANPENNKLKGGEDAFEFDVVPFIAKLAVLLIVSLIFGLIRYGNEIRLRKPPPPRTRFVVDKEGVIRETSEK